MARGVPIRDEDGRLYRMAEIGEDITDQKYTLQRMMQASHLASIGELSAGVAHEINNPLTAIILHSEILLEENQSEATEQGLRVISEQGKRAAKIVQDLLAFSQKSDSTCAESDISELVLRVLELKETEFRINNINTVVNVPPGLPLVSVEGYLMMQVLTNIITNSEQACVASRGRGTLTISGSVVAENVRISVADDGPGISSGDLAKIFEPFFTTRDVGAGSGLGLSVSHGIITQHGGQIWVESAPGNGSTCHIEVPIANRLELPGSTSQMPSIAIHSHP